MMSLIFPWVKNSSIINLFSVSVNLIIGFVLGFRSNIFVLFCDMLIYELLLLLFIVTETALRYSWFMNLFFTFSMQPMKMLSISIGWNTGS